MSKEIISETILGAIKYVTGCQKNGKPLGLHEPFFENTNAYKYVKDCIDSGWVSSAGEWVNEFERKICS